MVVLGTLVVIFKVVMVVLEAAEKALVINSLATQPMHQELVLLEAQILAAEAAAVEMVAVLMVALVVLVLSFFVTNFNKGIIWHTN